MNNFTPRAQQGAQQVLTLARKESERFNHNYVGTEHLLLGLIKLGQGVAVIVLQKMGLDLERVRMEVEKHVGPPPKYEAHHKAKLTDEALEAAVRLSDRYITGRFLPDKAIDVMDEAGARARINSMTRPPDVKELEKQIEAIRAEKEAAIKAQDYEKAATLRDFEKHTKDKLERILNGWREQRDEREVIVTGDDIMHIVSKWTGVPLNRMEQKEAQKLLKMEEELKQQVIGQDEAVIAISKALRRSRADLKDPRRPIGSSDRRRKNVSGTFLGGVHVW